MPCAVGARLASVIFKSHLSPSPTVMRLIITGALAVLVACIILASNLRVRKVIFEGAELSSQDALIKCRSSLLGQRILTLRRDVSKFFCEEPFVAGANARIVLPYTVVVVLRGRKPIGLIKTGGGLHVVFDNGSIYRRVESAEIKDVSELPVFISDEFERLRAGERLSDEDLKRLKRLLSLFSSVGFSGVRQVEFGSAREIKLRMRDGSIIELGSEVGLRERFALAAAVYAELKRKHGRPVAIDARSIKGCTYRLLE
ncbi:MAG: hypothetical protein GDYSWBUE_002177 [Candidatus Fervidibacterota bacterium]